MLVASQSNKNVLLIQIQKDVSQIEHDGRQQ
jgi:hypothetical protein